VDVDEQGIIECVARGPGDALSPEVVEDAPRGAKRRARWRDIRRANEEINERDKRVAGMDDDEFEQHILSGEHQAEINAMADAVHAMSEHQRAFSAPAAGATRQQRPQRMERVIAGTRPRPRGAGRPQGHATRSSAKSGDSPDDPDPDPDPPQPGGG
jgi:hypothetical protein